MSDFRKKYISEYVFSKTKLSIKYLKTVKSKMVMYDILLSVYFWLKIMT
jgi:hypothetical protein